MNYDINAMKLISPLEIIKLTEEASIKIGLYEKRGDKFYDVVFSLNDKEIFLGRFNKTFNSFRVKYNNGKILIYNDEYKSETNKMEIIKVLSLYEILDDTFYSCTEEEALKMFDNTIEVSFLKDKNRPIYRSDIEKTKRL